MSKHIGYYIKQARESLGMTQGELAEQLGYKTRSAIARIEKGDNDIPLSKVDDFAKVLHVSRHYLMGDKEQLEAVEEQQRIIFESDNAVEILRFALTKTGYFDGVNFTDDEIMELMQYANFLIMKRIADRRG